MTRDTLLAAEERARLVVRVIDASSRSALLGVRIFVEGDSASVSTDSAGETEVDMRAGTKRSVVARAIGYLPQRAVMDPRAGAVDSVTFVLTRDVIRENCVLVRPPRGDE